MHLNKQEDKVILTNIHFFGKLIFYKSLKNLK